MSAIGIVAHLNRVTMAETLAEVTAAQHIAYDDGTFGCSGNHQRVWAALADTHEDWAVVLEDDTQPVAGFHDQLAAALAAAPAPIVSLYLGRRRPLGAWQGRIQIATTAANIAGAHWIRSNHCLHAVGIAIRTDLIADLLASRTHDHLDADDAITHWAQSAGHDIAYTWPSLVDHNDEPSIAAHWDGKERKPGRVAWATGHRKTWNARTVEMRGHPRTDLRSTRARQR